MGKNNSKVRDVLNKQGEVLDRYVGLLTRAQGFLLARNNFLTKQNVETIKTNLEFDKEIVKAKSEQEGCLVKDSADVSLEQPSYMDHVDGKKKINNNPSKLAKALKKISFTLYYLIRLSWCEN